MTGPPRFEVPAVSDACPGGWGPGASVPPSLAGAPYAPFNKADRVGRVADFTSAGLKFGGRFDRRDREPSTAVFNLAGNEEDDAFRLVDNRPTGRARGGRRFGPNRAVAARRERERIEKERGEPPSGHAAHPASGGRGRGGPGAGGGRGGPGGRGGGGRGGYGRDEREAGAPSVDVRPEWAVVEQFAFSALTKLAHPAPPPTDVAFVGALEPYDRTFDRVTPRSERALRRTRRAPTAPRAADDPIFAKLAAEPSSTAKRVFVTDAMLALLMTAPRSVLAWDVALTRRGGDLWIDARRGSTADAPTVAETCADPPVDAPDSINGIAALRVEAAAAQRDWAAQALAADAAAPCAGGPLPYPPPPGGAPPAATAYRYRKFSLGGGAIDVYARFGIDAATTERGSPDQKLVALRALTEYDAKVTGVDWRAKLEAQRGAVLATELKNNAAKLARWAAAALAGGVDVIKLAFVSRVHPRDAGAHAVLGTHTVKPRDFAAQIALSMDNCWGVLHAVADLGLRLGEGAYLLVRDPAKPVARLYSVPEDAFDEEEEEEEGEGEGEGMDE